MTDDPTATIRKLLIKSQGVPEAEVTPHARILHDLGVDSDDAAEIFRELHAKFGTDFAELYRQWRIFFNTEDASPRAIMFGIPALILCGGGAGVLVAALHWPKLIAVMLALALFVGGGWLVSRCFGKDLQPLTVSGLAEIVRAGRWPTDPADVR